VASKTETLTMDARLIRFLDLAIMGLLYLAFFLIPIVFVIFTRDQFELPKLTVLRILTSGVIGLWLVRALLAKRWDWKRTPLDKPILAWVGLQLLTTVVSVSGFISFQGEYENFRGLMTVLNYPVLFYAAIHFIRTRAQIDRLLLVVLISGLLVTAYGLAQFFGLDFIAWNPDSVAPGRYFSSLGNPNFLAAFLAMVMPLTIVFFIETPSRFRRFFLFASFIVMFFCILGTWSRGGFLGLLAAFAVLALFGVRHVWRQLQEAAVERQTTRLRLLAGWGRAHRAWIILVLATLGILITITATFGRYNMLRFADTIIHLKAAVGVSRMHIWKPALGMIRDFPILGTGLDTFKTVFPRYATPAFAAIDGANVSSRTAHNEILQVLSTQGAIGLGIVTWLTVMILLLWRKAYRGASNRDRLILVGLLASYTAYSVQNLFSFGVVTIDTFYWLILALFVLLRQPPEEQAKTALPQIPEAKPGRLASALARFRTPVMAAVLAGSALLAWQFYKMALADYAYNLGTLYRMQGMWDASVAAFHEAKRLTPTEVKYVVYEGLAYEEKAKSVPDDQKMAFVQKAIASYEKGVRMNPTNAYYIGNLGRIYGFAASVTNDRNYFEKSVAQFQQAIRYAPVTVLFYQNLAMMYFTYKQEKDFWQVVDQLAGFDKKEAAKLAFNAGNQLYNVNLTQLAEGYYRKALALDDSYVEAYFNLGVILAELGRVGEAVTLWKKTLELKPEFEPAQQMLIRFGETP